MQALVGKRCGKKPNQKVISKIYNCLILIIKKKKWCYNTSLNPAVDGKNILEKIN